MQPKISVIVPVYKAEKYLHRCIDSILGQTFKDFELILVDDGSPDGSGVICDEYAAKDSRIKVIHKENGGVTAARKDGLNSSIGEWIMFVDADDSINESSMSDLYEVILPNIDIVIGAWKKIYNQNRRLIPLGIRGTLDNGEYIKALLSGTVYTGPVGKLFRKKIFTEGALDIPHYITNNEDLIMNLRIANNAKKIRVLPNKIVYNYYDNPGSASTRHMPIQSWDAVFELIINSLTHRYHKYAYSYIIYILYRNRNHTDVRGSKFFRTIKMNSLNFDGKIYYKALDTNSALCEFLVKVLYIKLLLKKCINNVQCRIS